jgi:hypothetical protein
VWYASVSVDSLGYSYGRFPVNVIVGGKAEVCFSASSELARTIAVKLNCTALVRIHSNNQLYVTPYSLFGGTITVYAYTLRLDCSVDKPKSVTKGQRLHENQSCTNKLTAS